MQITLLSGNLIKKRLTDTKDDKNDGAFNILEEDNLRKIDALTPPTDALTPPRYSASGFMPNHLEKHVDLKKRRIKRHQTLIDTDNQI